MKSSLLILGEEEADLAHVPATLGGAVVVATAATTTTTTNNNNR